MRSKGLLLLIGFTFFSLQASADESNPSTTNCVQPANAGGENFDQIKQSADDATAVADHEDINGQKANAPLTIVGFTQEQYLCLQSYTPEVCSTSARVVLPAADGPPPGVLAPPATTGPSGVTGPTSGLLATFRKKFGVTPQEALNNNGDSFLKDALKNKLDVDPSLTSRPPTDIGIHAGGEVIWPDQIARDPFMAETEAKESAAGHAGVWVWHELEVRPAIGGGLSSNGLNNALTKSGGVSVAHSMFVRFVKRHPLDKVYNTSFWGYTQRDAKLIEQSLPMIWHLPSDMKHNDFLPGEGVEVERYWTLNISTGSNVQSMTSQIAAFAVGGEANAGINFAHDMFHYKTIMEMEDGGKVRLVLELLKNNALGPVAQVDWDGRVPLVHSFSGMAAQAGLVWNFASGAHVLDLTIDLHNPKAEAALKAAYLGNFTLAQALAPNTAVMSANGIDFSRRVDIESHGTHGFWSLFSLGRSKTESAAVERSTTYHSDGNISWTVDDDDSLDHIVNGKKEDYHMFVSGKHDRLAQDQSLSRTMNVEFTEKGSNIHPDRSEEFLRVAQVVVPPENAAQLQNWIEKNKKGDSTIQLRMNVDFNEDALSALLRMGSGPELSGKYWTAWAKLIGAPDVDKWATYTKKQREASIKSLNSKDALEHLKASEEFVSRMDKALRKKSANHETVDYVAAIEKLGGELYPLGALMAISRQNEMMTFFRLTEKTGHEQQDTLQFFSKGDDYHLPGPDYAHVYH